MSRKQLVEQYLDGFRTGDPSKVLACLSEDVVWRLHGCQTFTGLAAFSANISNEDFCALPRLEVEALIEDGNRIVAQGSGEVNQESGSKRSFVFCEVFLIEQMLIQEIDTFHIWTSE